MKTINTEWTIITGAPSCGKTDTIKELQRQGKPCVQEAATIILEQRKKSGETLEEICADQRRLQWEIFELSAATEKTIDPSVPYYLDRSGIDCLGYLRLYGFDPAYILEHLNRYRFKHILQLDRLPLVQNGYRIEHEENAALLDIHLTEVYQELGYNVLRIPAPPLNMEIHDEKARIVQSIQERVSQILQISNGDLAYAK